MAEALGVNIFPGFAGKEVLFHEDHKTILGKLNSKKNKTQKIIFNQTFLKLDHSIIFIDFRRRWDDIGAHRLEAGMKILDLDVDIDASTYILL